jgi:hypothetical protein
LKKPCLAGYVKTSTLRPALRTRCSKSAGSMSSSTSGVPRHSRTGLRSAVSSRTLIRLSAAASMQVQAIAMAPRSNA